MQEEPNLHLFICGDFDVSEFGELTQFKDRVHNEGFVDWRSLPDLIARSDIQLMPLENNIFTRGKSQLKYYEAGIIGIPTVASPIPSFANSIKHGVTGFLATTEEEWFACLKNLVTNPNLLQEIGSNARADALAHFRPEVIGRRAVTVYREILREYRASFPERLEPRVIIRIANPDTALATRHPLLGIIQGFSKLGMSTIVSIPTQTNQQMLQKIRTSRAIGSDVRVFPEKEIRCCELLIAGESSSIQSLNQFSSRAESCCYLMVDQTDSFAQISREIECFTSLNWLPGISPNFSDRIHRFEPWAEELPIPAFNLAAIPEATLLIVLSDLPTNSIEAIRGAIELIHQRSPNTPVYAAGLVQSFHEEVNTTVSDLYSDEFYSLFMKSPVCVIAGTNGAHPLVLGLQKLGYPVILVETEKSQSLPVPAGMILAQSDSLDIYNRIESLHLDRVLLSRLAIEAKRAGSQLTSNPSRVVFTMLETLGFIVKNHVDKNVA